MGNRWFQQGTLWQSYTTEELEVLVRNGGLNPETLVRRVSTEDWRTVREVLASVAKPPEPEKPPVPLAKQEPIAVHEPSSSILADHEPDDASHSAARVLQEMAAKHATAKQSAESVSERLSNSVQSGAGFLQRLWAIPWELLSLVFDLFGSMISRINRRTILAAAFLLSLTLFAWASGMLAPRVKDFPDQINEIWRSAVELADRKPSTGEWNTFSQESLTRLSAISDKLEESQQSPGLLAAFQSATDNEWAKWELIQAAKFEIPRAIKAGPAELPEFSHGIENRLLKYEEFVARSSQPRIQNASAVNPDTAVPATGTKFDPTASLIIGIDILLVIGGIAWWLSRRRTA